MASPMTIGCYHRAAFTLWGVRLMPVHEENYHCANGSLVCCDVAHTDSWQVTHTLMCLVELYAFYMQCPAHSIMFTSELDLFWFVFHHSNYVFIKIISLNAPFITFKLSSKFWLS